ncbi:ribokinase [Jiangella rhizosphaerae]|uniref:Ribokinase n=1 Tax=Jiangella rhizosphaerae TaxID=2293569 RepID=A0A418KQS1_9ACTN|nr:ribokinase [Jiangella rhizosphaerae]RIQ22867.1 ribokinase [Jiangella rhizosphaerae]
MGDVVVVGSANLDRVARVARPPAPGETVLAASYSEGLGGKGMNQAVAAALLGASVRFVGAVGADADGDRVRSALAAAGVDGSAVRVLDGVPTGTALVTVGADGDNAIVVAAGANAAVTSADVERALAGVPAGTVLVTQLEIPDEAVAAVARVAAGRGARLVLNAAPYRPLPADVLAAADPLVVNELEAAALAGDASPADRDVDAVAAGIAGRCRSVVVTLGAAGALVVEGTTVTRCPAPPADVVDTTGAGDAFVGALAAGLAAGRTLATTLPDAIAAASASVGSPGAQASYPAMARAVRPRSRA